MRRKAIVPATVLLVMAVACATPPSADLSDNKDLVRRFTEAGNAADWSALAEIVSENLTRHSAATAVETYPFASWRTVPKLGRLRISRISRPLWPGECQHEERVESGPCSLTFGSCSS